MGAPACSCGPEKSVVVRILEKLRLYAWIHKMQTAKMVEPACSSSNSASCLPWNSVAAAACMGSTL
eukprot:scaffold5480_cov26-Tisochrysis_lutea.AAC.1